MFVLNIVFIVFFKVFELLSMNSYFLVVFSFLLMSFCSKWMYMVECLVVFCLMFSKCFVLFLVMLIVMMFIFLFLWVLLMSMIWMFNFLSFLFLNFLIIVVVVLMVFWL